jgi:hypothetical protein
LQKLGNPPNIGRMLAGLQGLPCPWNSLITRRSLCL